MEYRVVCSVSANIKGANTGLVNQIQNLIEEGFKPQGGISVSENDAGWITVCQAMVKE